MIKKLTILQLIKMVGGRTAFANEFGIPLSSGEKLTKPGQWPQHRVDAYEELYERRLVDRIERRQKLKGK